MRLMPIYRWNKQVVRLNRGRVKITKYPWFQGALLLVCVIIAMLLANLPFTRDLYYSVLDTNVQITLLSENGHVNCCFPRDMTVEKFINDILMTIFFLTVGLEIKREITYGELSSVKKALMPVIAAFGGVVAPALIFTLVNHGTAASSGWGIPTATDIAFAVCILTVLGDKVPVSMKVFLTALAIVDDLIAIIVVALFYGGKINFVLLAIAAVVVGLALLIRRLGEKRLWPYLLMAVIVWTLFYYSGIHSTMSGVVMAFIIPATARYNKSQYIHKRNHYIKLLDELDSVTDDVEFPNGPQKSCLRKLHNIANNSMDISYRVEHALTPWVNYIIMPLFALANAGVEITNLSYFNVFTHDAVLGGVGMGVFLGLLLGKPIGITLASFAAVKFKAGEMPANTNWPMFFAVACLGGIGFTMSIFVDTLSFGDQAPQITAELRNAGKIAVLMGSVCSGILGTILVNMVSAIKRHKSD